MRKNCLIFGTVLAALTLCGCENKGTRTVVYTDPVPYLTTVTVTESIPADTYSEYMETYVPETTTGTDVYYYSVTRANTLHADTGATARKPEQADIPKATAPTRVTAVTSAPEEGSEAVTEVPSSAETEQQSETVKQTILPMPNADTAATHKISADTTGSEESESSITTSNGGTTDAN